jgi:hypothetical protein
MKTVKNIWNEEIEILPIGSRIYTSFGVATILEYQVYAPELDIINTKIMNEDYQFSRYITILDNPENWCANHDTCAFYAYDVALFDENKTYEYSDLSKIQRDNICSNFVYYSQKIKRGLSIEQYFNEFGFKNQFRR